MDALVVHSSANDNRSVYKFAAAAGSALRDPEGTNAQVLGESMNEERDRVIKETLNQESRTDAGVTMTRRGLFRSTFAVATAAAMSNVPAGAREAGQATRSGAHNNTVSVTVTINDVVHRLDVRHGFANVSDATFNRRTPADRRPSALADKLASSQNIESPFDSVVSREFENCGPLECAVWGACWRCR